MQAATEVMQRQRKRALVILVSTLREEDKSDVLSAVQMMRQRHLVVVANLRENVVDEALAQQPSDLRSALDYAAAHAFDAGLVDLTRWLQTQGVFCVDEVPAQLHVAMVSQYLALKRSGLV